MYDKMLVPVDLAAQCKAEICFLAVGTNTPSPVSHIPKEFEQRLSVFVQDRAGETGLKTSAVTKVANDPALDLSKFLVRQADEIGADVVVMASYLSGIADHIFASHGGYLAAHSDLLCASCVK